MASRICSRLLGVATAGVLRGRAGVLRHYHGLCRPTVGRPAAALPGLVPRFYHQTELEEEFHEMVDVLEEIDKTIISFNIRSQLGAYYRQATKGPCDVSPSDVADVVENETLEIWQRLGDMEPIVAMANFIELVKSVQTYGEVLEIQEKKDLATFEEEQMAFTIYGKEDLVVTVQDHIQVIRFNRPAKRNAITLSMFQQLTKVLEESSLNDDIYVTVLTGSGEYYSSGNDLSNFDLSNTTLPELIRLSRTTLERFVAAFIDHPKVLVAAVNGPAVGIAVTTLGLCDLVVASTEATFHTPFTSLGQSPEGCSSYLFPRFMGPAKANDVLLLGHKLSAREAAESRLVTRLINPMVFEKDFMRMARWMTSLPQESLRKSRSLIRSYDREKLHEVNRLECDLLERCWASRECLRALEQFATRQKRKVQRRLEDMGGRDHRLVGERVERLEDELQQSAAMLAQLPDPTYNEYPELEIGENHVLPSRRLGGSGRSQQTTADSAGEIGSGEEAAAIGSGEEAAAIASGGTGKAAGRNDDKKEDPQVSTPWK